MFQPPIFGRPRVPTGSPTPRHPRVGDQFGRALAAAGQVGGGRDEDFGGRGRWPSARGSVEGKAFPVWPGWESGDHSYFLVGLKESRNVRLCKQLQLDVITLVHQSKLCLMHGSCVPNYETPLVWQIFFSSLGRLDEAAVLLQRGVAGSEARLGTTHQNTLRSVHHLAVLRVAQGRSDEAEPLFRRALEGLETQLGLRHQWTLETMSGLAKLLEAKGSLQEAGKVWVRVLQDVLR